MKLTTTLVFLLTIFTTLLISGCNDKRVSLSQICSEQAQICDDIESEGWCKQKRADLIVRRYNAIESPDDQDNQYRTLMAWHDFNQCIELAASITRKNVLDRTSQKASAYLVSLEGIARLEQQTRASTLPQLLYYHWVIDGDPSRVRLLIRLDRRNKLATTELQLMMASYYAKVDKKKEMTAQYNALRYLDSNDMSAVDNQLFASLATSFLQQNNYRLAYIWTKIAEQSGLKTNNSNSLQRQLSARSVDLNRLQTIAKRTFDSIKSHDFITPESQL